MHLLPNTGFPRCSVEGEVDDYKVIHILAENVGGYDYVAILKSPLLFGEIGCYVPFMNFLSHTFTLSAKKCCTLFQVIENVFSPTL